MLSSHEKNTIRTAAAAIELQSKNSANEQLPVLWTYIEPSSGRRYPIEPPLFELNRQTVLGVWSDPQITQDADPLPNGTFETRVAGTIAGHSDLILTLIVRLAPDNPIVRFRYMLSSRSGVTMTKSHGRDALLYAAFQASPAGSAMEVRFSDYNELVHSYKLTEQLLDPLDFKHARSIMGPMLVAMDGAQSFLFAYEHGSQYPDTYLSFRLQADHRISVEAEKGNYFNGRHIMEQHPFETVWFQIGAITGPEAELASAYRTFILQYQCLNAESRKPYIFYNTWAYQERNAHWSGSKYLDSMNLERMLKEIEVAHQIGIEVFVMDTGWYRKTGDWEVNTSFFPDELKSVKAKLDEYNMKLGLWFDPQKAAITSRMLERNRTNQTSEAGVYRKPHTIWETETSSTLCLVSSYSDDFVEELIRLYRELGVTYFKWDAISQYGCDDPNHNHGDEGCSEQERAECFSFELPLTMARIVEKLASACPDAIVDFDVTEGYRSVGLSFLSAGKYFLINNGPYFRNYDIPKDRDIQWKNNNIFFFPGPARGWVCRKPLAYDKWVPSVLFLTHYLPDDPEDNQDINAASLILGQNGIWGDLPAISPEGIDRLHGILSRYKVVRDDITASSVIQSGEAGTNPEIYEKISKATGRGVIVMFASSFGQPFHNSRPAKHSYISRHKVHASKLWNNEGVSVIIDNEGHALIHCHFDRPGAKIIFFGVE
ncbi:alpha-galactosidase [Paenibacillus sp. GCM10023252]|uniref:alpha-galactosidase n=1 Tax=Paenibacillus sp. GCM10023252 TaxID=3252649 RepID=UPI003618D935